MKYTCTTCQAVCESNWTEEEAVAEKERDFGSVPLDKCDIVCDVCYQQVSPENNPDAYTDYLAATSDHSIHVQVPLPSGLESGDAMLVTIKTYIDNELCRMLAEYLDQEEAGLLLGTNP